MDKRVVIISASLRKNSNSEQLAEAFAKGAASAGMIRKSYLWPGREWGSVQDACPVRRHSAAICRMMRQSLLKK